MNTMPSPKLNDFGGCIKRTLMVISYAKHVNFLYYTVMHRGLKATSLSKKSLNMIVNFMGGNLTYQVNFVDL